MIYDFYILYKAFLYCLYLEKTTASAPLWVFY